MQVRLKGREMPLGSQCRAGARSPKKAKIQPEALVRAFAVSDQERLEAAEEREQNGRARDNGRRSSRLRIEGEEMR